MPITVTRTTSDVLLGNAEIRLRPVPPPGTGIGFDLGLPYADSDGKAGVSWIQRTLAAAVSETAITAGERTALLAILSKLSNFYRASVNLTP